MKVLILVENYPNNAGGVALMYVHTRNIYYKKAGIEVDVLNFRASEPYKYDDINVLTYDAYKKHDTEYDILVLHAANLKHHYFFLKKYGKRFRRMVFFYHGHEVLRINKVYSKPYSYIRHNKIKKVVQNIYDEIKLAIWRKCLPKLAYKSEYIFVSNWMLEEFINNTKLQKSDLKDHCLITYNSVGQEFEDNAYDECTEKKYDFITIRGYLDDSKYAVDIVNELAKRTPEGKFLLIGKGEFFNHFNKADNLEWRNQHLTHKEIIEALNSARFALMPTRTDAQGLMMCEMAAFGIPVITSDIPVCHEVFDGFSNVFFISNSNYSNLDEYLSCKSICKKDNRYFASVTVAREIELLKKIGTSI